MSSGDPMELRGKMAMASLVAVGWLFAAWLPLVVVGFLSPLPFNFLAFLFFLYAYLGYSGFERFGRDGRAGSS